MGLGTSLLLIAVGAILRFAVNVTTQGFNLHTVGVILIVLGLVGLLISLLWMTAWADRRHRVVAEPRRDAVIVRDPDVPV
jgi:sulfite exporter TauE/SafE